MKTLEIIIVRVARLNTAGEATHLSPFLIVSKFGAAPDAYAVTSPIR
jgi:hypothetical protein